jgi:hypothetical protein
MNEVVNELAALVGGASNKNILSHKGTSRHNRKSSHHGLSSSNSAFHLIADKANINCWDVKKCGRTPGGNKVKEYGVCPAYPNNGQSCWNVAGTFCGGKVQGDAAQKRGGCLTCNFFKDHQQGSKVHAGANSIPLDDGFNDFNM